MINTALRKIAAPITNKSLLISVLLFTAIVIFAIFINTWNHFKQSFVQTQQALTFQSRLLERSITRTLESVEATILSIESVLAAESLNVGPENADDNIRSSEILRQQLDQSLHFSSHIRQIVITEGDRIIIDSSSRSEGSNINFHEMGLDFEDAAVRQRNQGLAFFSRSTSRFLPIMDDGSMAIRHSIFITGIQSGSYSSSGKPYWIFVALNPDYFVDFFLSETDDTDNSLLKNINIVDFEGNNLVSLLSATTEQSPVQSFLKSGYNQQYITTDYAVHALTTSETYPLIISISTSRKSILRQWWLENQNNLIWMSVLVSLLVFSGVTLMFEFRRRLTIQNQMVLLSSALEQSDAAILLTDSDQRIEYVNPSAERMFGYSASTLIGIKPSILASGDTDPTILKSLRDTIKKGENWQGELVNKTIDGRLKTVSTRISAVFSDSGYISHFVAVMEDITLRRQAESELQLAASVFSTAHEGILITNVDGVVININEAFTRITGYDREEILGKNPKILSSGLQDADFYKDMWHQLAVKGRWYGEIWNRRKNGEVYAELLSISAVRNNHEEVQHYVAMFSDITSIKEYQDRLEHIAHFDALTNLPNRVLLSDRLHQAMLRTMRVGRKMAVVFLDLDGFKEINDHYGHDNGDELL
ncbi:MAG: PAS domain S-box protein, partial [Oceanospirillales bacterium]